MNEWVIMKILTRESSFCQNGQIVNESNYYLSPVAVIVQIEAPDLALPHSPSESKLEKVLRTSLLPATAGVAKLPSPTGFSDTSE